MTLSAAIADPDRKEALVLDALDALEAEVDGLGGFKGKLVEVGYDAVGKLRPNFIRSNVEHMLPAFVEVIDPHLATARSSVGVDRYFSDKADEIADDLLKITDARAEKAHNVIAKGIYSKMRGIAKKYVSNATPRLGALANKHG